MSRLVWLLAGLLLGTAAARNAAAMTAPQVGAVVLVAVVVCWVCWLAGRRDKVSAVATAVAVARAEASANAEAQAAAIAQAAVHLHLTQQLAGTHAAPQALGEAKPADALAPAWHAEDDAAWHSSAQAFGAAGPLHRPAPPTAITADAPPAEVDGSRLPQQQR